MPSAISESPASELVLPAESSSLPSEFSSLPVDPAITTFIDGLDVTSIVLEGTVTRRLNRPSVASVRMPTELTGEIGVQVGSRLKVIDEDYGMLFHGLILTMSDEADEDKLYTQMEATDPMELWRWRPARDGLAAAIASGNAADQGNFSLPTFIERNVTGPQMMEEILVQSEEVGGIPDDAEGPLFLEYDSGSFEGGGEDLTGAPVDWPMTIAEIANLLTSTGEVDIILTPIDSGGNMAELNVYNGDYGNDLTGSLAFEYETGAYNVRLMRRVDDMSTMANKIWYYLGPKIDEQHWRASITNASPITVLPDPPQADIEDLKLASQAQYGVRMEIKIFDGTGDEYPVGAQLYGRLWQLESWLRAQPRSLVHITPIRNTPINFDIGDLVTVTAGAKLRGGFTGAQRIYEFTVSWDENGVRELSEIVTTATQEGI